MIGCGLHEGEPLAGDAADQVVQLGGRETRRVPEEQVLFARLASTYWEAQEWNSA